mgnify:CR=1 FL=1
MKHPLPCLRKTAAAFTALLLLGLTACSPAPEVVPDSPEADAYLLETGMPQETIDSLDDSLKQVIWETAPETPQEFVSVETETSEDCIPFIVTSSLPSESFSVSTVVFRGGTYEGDEVYAFYPIFQWQDDRHIAGDVFGFSLPEGWRVVPGEQDLSLYEKSGENWAFCGALGSACSAGWTGYGFDGFGDFCKGKGVYQGVGYLRAYKSQDSAPNEISVVYGHEDSLGGVQFNRQLRIDPQPDNVQISSHNGAKLKDRDIVFQF